MLEINSGYCIKTTVNQIVGIGQVLCALLFIIKNPAVRDSRLPARMIYQAGLPGNFDGTDAARFILRSKRPV